LSYPSDRSMAALLEFEAVVEIYNSLVTSDRISKGTKCVLAEAIAEEAHQHKVRCLPSPIHPNVDFYMKVCDALDACNESITGTL